MSNSIHDFFWGGVLKVVKSNFVMAFTTISQFGITENNKFFLQRAM